MTDSSTSSTSSVLKTVANLGVSYEMIEIDPALADTVPVSYTHLTLPTIA